MDFSSICMPARVYAILTIFTLIGSIFATLPNFPLIQIIKSLFFNAVWFWILNWICSKGFVWLSWFLVVLPYIILIAALIATIFIVKIETEQKKKRN